MDPLQSAWACDMLRKTSLDIQSILHHHRSIQEEEAEGGVEGYVGPGNQGETHCYRIIGVCRVGGVGLTESSSGRDARHTRE